MSETPDASTRQLAGTPRTRLVGVDVARGVALLGMIAVHVFDDFTKRGEPTVVTEVAAGRSATLFVLLAGVGLALLSGGRHPAEGRGRTAVRAATAVRAVLIGAIGLWMGDLAEGSDVDVILAYYGVLFLLAIPLLGLPVRRLALLSGALIVLAPPAVLWATAAAGPADLGSDGNPTFASLFDEPGQLVVGLLLTGAYPVLAYLAYLAAGLAIGRLDLSSRRVAVGLVAGGLGLAGSAWLLSDLLLFRMGGMTRLLDADTGVSSKSAVNQLLWGEGPVDSWWYLAVPAPHSNTPIDLAHTLGSAMAVLGVALLLCRTRVITRWLRPLAAAGSMTLTLYCGHVLILAAGVVDDQLTLYLLLVVLVLGFGFFWQRWFGQGPLERLVGAISGRARRAVAGPPAPTDSVRLPGSQREMNP